MQIFTRIQMCKIDDDGLFHNFAICVARMVCDESEIFFFFFLFS